MRSPMRQLSCLGIAALLVLAPSGCKPPPENVKIKERVIGPPDLAKDGNVSPANRSFQLSAFHLNHIWATTHSAPPRGYRAKITVWDYADDHSAVAELYFDDTADGTAATVPDPASAKRPYQIHFPITTVGPILSALRNSNEPVFLYYYEGAWAVGTYSAEQVGVD
jgi:hypothetical protein